MFRLVKLHIGLFQYLRVELRKKRTLKELIKFSKDLIVRYVTIMLKEYKSIFLFLDPLYIKQKKDYDKYQKIKIDLQRCLKMLNYIDEKMEKQGIPRWKRRQFWRDFHNNGQVRKEEFDALLREIG